MNLFDFLLQSRGVPQNALPLDSSAVLGREYLPQTPGARSDAAGYTTSSPGWRRDSPFPAAPAAAATPAPSGGKKAGAKGGGGDKGPQTTGAINPPSAAENATTTPSALFQPLSNVGEGSPSALFQPLPTQSPTSVPGLPGFGAQSPSSLGTFLGTPGPTNQPGLGDMRLNQLANPALAGPPPALNMPPINNPALAGVPPALVAAAQPQPQPQQGPGPSSVPPSRVMHPDNPTVGRRGPLGKGRAQTSKTGGQYSLRQEGERRR